MQRIVLESRTVINGKNKKINPEIKDAINTQRYELLEQLEKWLELPMLLLGFIWLILLFIELLWGLNPALQFVVYFIWGIFILDFLIRFILAPYKSHYLKENWLTAISLFVPVLRIFRIVRIIRLLRLARAVRGLQLLKIISTLNREMRSLQAKLRRRRFGYIVVFTFIVVILGAAGMYTFENQYPGSAGFRSYSDSLWWTAMIITTQGSEYWPKSPEGRVLGFILSVYAFTVFGYVTATLASYFVGKDKEEKDTQRENLPVPTSASIEELKKEIISLRESIAKLDRR